MLGVIAENDGADLGFLQVQRQAGDAVAEVQHLVEHRVGQAFDLGHAVADFADDADVLLGRRGLHAGDLASISCNMLLINASHQKLSSNAASRACTLPSYTSLPTCIRSPPINAGF